MKQIQQMLTIACRQHGFTDITPDVRRQVRDSGIATALLCLFIRDVGCSLSIQERSNPETLQDMEILVAHSAPDEHQTRRPDSREITDAHDHTRMALTNVSLSIPVQNGRPVLGTWQAVCLYEHHSHARQRRVFFHLIGD